MSSGREPGTPGRWLPEAGRVGPRRRRGAGRECDRRSPRRWNWKAASGKRRKEGSRAESPCRDGWRNLPSWRCGCPQKKMVPSDPISQPNSPPACIGTELRNQTRRVISLPLPAAFFGRLRINAFRFTCQLPWPELVSRSGLSLSRNDCPFPGHHFEVEAPDLLLQYPAVRPSCPFGFQLPDVRRFAPARARSPPESRCLTSVRHSQPFVGSPLPFRAFRTLPDQSVRSDSWPGSPPSKRSRWPFAPWLQFYFTSLDTRSPLRAR